jgi:inorganic pyrophosphatase
MSFASTQAAKLRRAPLDLLTSASSPTPPAGAVKNPTQNILEFSKIASQRTNQIFRQISSSSPSPDKMSYGKQPPEFSVRKLGAPNTLEFRAYIEKDGTPVSPFHDVPLYANEQQTVLNMVVEIPRWTNAKLEVRCTITKD